MAQRNAAMIRSKSNNWRLLSEMAAALDASDALLETLSEIGGKSEPATTDAWRRARDCCLTAAEAVQRCNKREAHACDVPVKFIVLSELCGHEASMSERKGPRVSPADLAACQDSIKIYLQKQAQPAK